MAGVASVIERRGVHGYLYILISVLTQDVLIRKLCGNVKTDIHIILGIVEEPICLAPL